MPVNGHDRPSIRSVVYAYGLVQIPRYVFTPMKRLVIAYVRDALRSTYAVPIVLFVSNCCSYSHVERFFFFIYQNNFFYCQLVANNGYTVHKEMPS